MNTYNVGDLVEATKGETVVRGRIGDAGVGPFIDVGDLWTLALENEGYTIRTIEKATPPLPTEPGHYVRESRDCVYTLSSLGDWWYGSEMRSAEQMPDRVPLTRLEPVADTAKKIIDQIRARESIIAGSHVVELHNIRAVATEFGVTS